MRYYSTNTASTSTSTSYSSNTASTSASTSYSSNTASTSVSTSYSSNTASISASTSSFNSNNSYNIVNNHDSQMHTPFSHEVNTSIKPVQMNTFIHDDHNYCKNIMNNNKPTNISKSVKF